ncbi:MAG TPA: hypothetical protein VHV08_15740 [Pirellulales bacterium]|nr:hypothetical protein [Pirellulales bacterium]
MDAHLVRLAALAAAIASLGANYRTQNFVVTAPTPAAAEQIGRAAEQFRRQLALDWLGQEMPSWGQPCPITAQVGDQLGAGGATSFIFEHGEVFGWRMTIQGSLERILDSVLPHEVTHTVFATHFRQPLPRWADEGACTTVEHVSEKSKQQAMLIEFLRTGRGIAFNQMFAMKDYPHDVMPLYSQGYSVARYLVAQGGRRKFLDFLADGMRDENWPRATQKHYGVTNLAVLQNNWLEWVRKGSPPLAPGAASPALVAVKTPSAPRRPQPDEVAQGQGEGAAQTSAGLLAQATAGDNSPSVYELARNSAGGRASRTDGWHAPRPSDTEPSTTDNERDTRSSGDVADDRTDAAHQVTRPQEIQRPRQVILEWSRPYQSAGDTRAAAPGG